MDDEKFNSLEELYKRVTPALHSRKRELRNEKLHFITEKDIWCCLKETKWRTEKNLTLFDIVNDILHIPTEDILMYLKNKQGENDERENNL